jgi:hypothetical protein
MGMLPKGKRTAAAAPVPAAAARWNRFSSSDGGSGMGAYASPPPLTGRGGDVVRQWHASSHRYLALACACLSVGAAVCDCDPPPCRVEALPPSPRSVLSSSMVRGAVAVADSAVGF